MSWFKFRKGWLGIANLKKIYKDRLDLGQTWLKWLPHSMEQYGRLAPKSNKVNYQKLTLSYAAPMSVKLSKRTKHGA